jgi:hypothetical protein
MTLHSGCLVKCAIVAMLNFDGEALSYTLRRYLVANYPRLSCIASSLPSVQSFVQACCARYVSPMQLIWHVLSLDPSVFRVSLSVSEPYLPPKPGGPPRPGKPGGPPKPPGGPPAKPPGGPPAGGKPAANVSIDALCEEWLKLTRSTRRATAACEARWATKWRCAGESTESRARSSSTRRRSRQADWETSSCRARNARSSCQRRSSGRSSRRRSQSRSRVGGRWSVN